FPSVPGGTEAIPRGGLLAPDSLLLRKRRDERFPWRARWWPAPGGGTSGSEDRNEVPRRVSRGSALRPTTCDLYDTADEHRAYLRHDLLPVWAERRDHRPGTVLGVGDCRYPVRGRPRVLCPAFLLATSP